MDTGISSCCKAFFLSMAHCKIHSQENACRQQRKGMRYNKSMDPHTNDLVLAKWKSLIRHIANKHEDHPDLLFPKCMHEELDRRKWIKIGKIIT